MKDKGWKKVEKREKRRLKKKRRNEEKNKQFFWFCGFDLVSFNPT